MDKSAKIYVAGHSGLAGSALCRALKTGGYSNLVTQKHAELDLTDARTTNEFFLAEKPAYVFLAAAKVGGILANDTYPAEFIRDNLAIQSHVIHAAWRHDVKRLLFLGSSCIYPKLAPQPLREAYLLTGPLEASNRPYALAKIAGVEMCWSYNRQYGTQFLAAMPTNLYGPGDNYHPDNSHVIPALIRKFHEAKIARSAQVEVWGTGTPRREFMYSDDMAEACLFLMNLPQFKFEGLLGDRSTNEGALNPPMINVGVGEDVSIAQLAHTIKHVVGYHGEIIFDSSKPDGTPRKLLDVSRLTNLGFQAGTGLAHGIAMAYAEFVKSRTTLN